MTRRAQAAPAPELKTRRELVADLGVAPRTFARWLEEGLPVAERGRGGRASRYDPAAVRAWVEAQEKAASGKGPHLDAIQARAEKDLWQARLAEQTHKMRERELLPAAEVEKAWGAVLVAARARLLAVPIALADRITRTARLDGPAGVQRELEDAVAEVLRELAALDVTKEAPPPPAKGKARASRKPRARGKRKAA